MGGIGRRPLPSPKYSPHKVNYPSELFSIVTRLNELDTVKKAVPEKIRKYLKTDIALQAQKKRERLKAALEKSKLSNFSKSSDPKSGNTSVGKTNYETKNFLNPDAN